MTIKDIANLITQRGYIFEVSIPGTSFRAGKTTINNCLNDSASVEDYLARIQRSNNAQTMLVKLWSQNGSSYKLRGEHVIFLDQTEPVATRATNVATTATNVATAQQMLQQPATNVATKGSSGLAGVDIPDKMNVRDLVAFGVLQAEHRLLTARASELESEVNRLRKQVDTLHGEKLDLVRTNSVQKEKNDLEIERTKLEAERGQKEGLSGLIGELQQNPETLKLLIGLWKPDHPMLRPENPQIGSAPAAATHDDPQAAALINELVTLLSGQSGETIAQIFVIVAKLLERPDQRMKLYEQCTPKQSSNANGHEQFSNG